MKIAKLGLLLIKSCNNPSLAPAVGACDALARPAERLVTARAGLHVKVHLVLMEAPHPGARFNRKSYCLSLAP